MSAESKNRRALAGLGMLRGQSMFQALTAAGYAESTAQNPSRNGLTVKRCVEAAAEIFPGCEPGTLLRDTRRLLKRRLDDLNEGGELYRKTRTSELGRLVDTVERYFGAAAKPDGDSNLSARDFAARLDWIRRAAEHYRSLSGQDPTELADSAADPADGAGQ